MVNESDFSIEVDGDDVTIKFKKQEGVRSKRGNSDMLFSTNGFLKLDEYGLLGEMLSMNYIRR